MIRHIVMWKLKDPDDSAALPENAAAVQAALESLRNVVPGICNLEIGIDKGNTSDSCDVVLLADFDNMEALRSYQIHPAHVQVGDFIGSHRLERHVVDYAIPE